MHHYCRAILYTHRAELAGVPRQQERFLYERASKDYLYSLDNSAADMPLVPEILVRLGEAYLKIGQTSDAQAAFERARRVKPDYWPAYSRWIEVLISLNLRTQARDLATEGLSHAPDSAVLQRQFKALGGDPSLIKAVAVAGDASPSGAGSPRATESPASAPK